MKQLILLLGPNGVGKSTASHALMRLMPGSAYVDSDPLRTFNIEFDSVGYALHLANMRAVICNYLDCAAVGAVILPYGLHGHRHALLDELTRDLCTRYELDVRPLVLRCSREENIRRMKADGRDAARIARALECAALYDTLDCPALDVTELTAEATAHALLDMLTHGKEA